MKFFNVLILATIIFFTMAEKNNHGTFIYYTQSQKPLFSFGIVADIQYCDCDPAGTRFYRSSLTKLSEALYTFKKDSVDFMINLGDIIDRDINSYKPVLNLINTSGIKTHNVTGNHDYSVDGSYKKILPVISSSGKNYYSFIYKNYRFIFLDGNDLSTYISDSKTSVKKANDYIAMLKEKGEINALDWNGGIGNKQLQWLKQQMEISNNNQEKVFLICHFPLFPENVHNLLNYKEVLSILDKYNNIIAWINGHNHAGEYGNFNMIHFVTFRGMVETEASNSYAIVEVYNDKIWIKGYGREKSQMLAY